MKWSVEKQTIVGFGLASVVLVSINLLFYGRLSRHKQTFHSVTHTYQVLEKLKTTLSELKDAETGQRGYVITGEERYLEPYYKVDTVIQQDIQALKELTVDSPSQQKRLSHLEPLIVKRLAVMQQTIALRREQGFTAAQKFVKTDLGKNLMDRIRLLMGEMENQENQLLQQRLEQDIASDRVSTIIFSTGVVCNLLILCLTYYIIRRESDRRREAQAALQQVNAELEIKVAERTEDLRLTNEQLICSQAELHQSLETERELNNLRSRIIATISHEYRTPLTTILSSAELLEVYGHKWSNEKKLTHLGRIQTSAKYLTNLVSDVLFISKAEANKLEFNPLMLNLKKFCEDLIEQFDSESESQTAISFSYQGDGNQVYIDEKLLRQILTNLLSNAIKYSPAGGTIQFIVECSESFAQFWIQDQGIGIPAAEQQHVFEFFHRASNVGTLPGTGLGLAVVKKCVDLHGGQVALESFVNQGTTFRVMLPFAIHTPSIDTLACPTACR